MKWAWLVVGMGVVLSGCTSVAEIEHSPETLSVISGKTPKQYTDCLVAKLADTRKPSTVEPHKEGFRVIVPQKMSSGPAAVITIDERSSGSSIKVQEHLQNFPLRPGDVRKAATACISG
ncbi:hypothetical protein [Pseudomonas sp. dw_358]|uniref:hypothetical protein n=1 Tax=Pseudomonas sp. dw_358 TaxID=2720083 RepID=UPI001BD30D8D|nr:hypothetical protein [Pseudomonas sp. dw_358]